MKMESTTSCSTGKTRRLEFSRQSLAQTPRAALSLSLSMSLGENKQSRGQLDYWSFSPAAARPFIQASSAGCAHLYSRRVEVGARVKLSRKGGQEAEKKRASKSRAHGVSEFQLKFSSLKTEEERARGKRRRQRRQQQQQQLHSYSEDE